MYNVCYNINHSCPYLKGREALDVYSVHCLMRIFDVDVSATRLAGLEAAAHVRPYGRLLPSGRRGPTAKASTDLLNPSFEDSRGTGAYFSSFSS
ncbi:hypothetical protein J6590_054641 [Homalodisca vitripennis]|nr:hypothetical protein J6590_054641 [Homalodisca vitripennis]